MAHGCDLSGIAIVLCLCACGGPTSAEASTERAARVQPIIGGTDAAASDWLWDVRVQRGGAFICGGALIAPEWVLTAAHCITQTPSGYSVKLRSGVTVAASQYCPRADMCATVFSHPSYVDDQAVTGHFDMGLIHLASPVPQGSGAQYIRLAVDGDAPGISATAIGWGMTNVYLNEPRYPDKLQQVSLPVLPSDTCNNVLPVRRTIYPDELCAGYSDGASGVCFGDSGAALMSQRASGTWEHIGVPSGVSIGEVIVSGESLVFGCYSYGIFARTSAMQSWVRRYVPDPAWSPAINLTFL